MCTHYFKSTLLALCTSLLLSSGFAFADQSFVDTKTGQPMKIDSGLFNTEQSKKFLSTGENPYNGNA